MRLSLLALLAGFLLDLLLGDPAWIYHPIRMIGNLIAALEKLLRRLFKVVPAETEKNPKIIRFTQGKSADRALLEEKFHKREFAAGTLLAVCVVLISAGVPLLLLLAAQMVHPYLRLVIESLLCWQLLATKSLRDESMKVYRVLQKNDIKGARKAVSMIVGRDTENLDAAGVTKAAVETVAENTSDGVIAPMFYMAIGGAVLGFFYKAINTMDSMLGYKNDRYLYFGRFAAKLDDVVNFLPARLSALFMIAASFLLRMDAKNAWRIFRRDRLRHASPNSAQTEAVMAGALDVQLAGDAWYFGVLHVKETIGDDIRPIETEDIVRANRLLYMTAVLALVFMAAVKWICICL
ncbi:cobalamin biosynthesis protein CobD family protein [Marvinbryantia formatexigens DSM 14469]|uniref:Cobalamin biosynthesis protein CobD n=1 Tax=Marvinbryantia formatexigens DSM 14469 TaxID=478749 RepID=C6L9T1_9FIRM|nr:adenosylcobinamide-phosphate synthase CbiB [Marvinbryantia formatexigens]EET62338.1 cobalamin biosynthesis protein CobD family protein [Marvinbryantia formatexigens DSM 14469]UWO25105.1 adenosylcobinamide-phosphate synthase CbiB [Marvinbryantia formatexigens DSM 14469]SDG95664.1 adenosylcobinamide-phosphate synthase [Marvinbryantia formatexigens]